MKRNPWTKGFSLVEVVVAIGIAVFCLVPIFALLPVGLQTNQATFHETIAASLAGTVSTDLRATPSAIGSSPYFGLTLPSSGSAAVTSTIYLSDTGVKLTVPSSTGPTYLATIVLTPSASGTMNASTARILITWPALANQANGTVPTQYAGSFETLIGLPSH
jgi:uncharacterized protein (TIGR02598 family)